MGQNANKISDKTVQESCQTLMMSDEFHEVKTKTKVISKRISV